MVWQTVSINRGAATESAMREISNNYDTGNMLSDDAIYDNALNVRKEKAV
jgi:hypothetical protein